MSIRRRSPAPASLAVALALAALLVHPGTGAAANWVPDGVRLCNATLDQTAPLGAPDGQGGAYVVWIDHRGPSADLYAQHVNSAGNLVAGWPDSGLVVCNDATNQQAPAIAADGAGGAYVVWQDVRTGNIDIYAQRLASAGISAGWPANGLSVCSAVSSQQNPAVCGDGTGGALVAWQDARGVTEDVYVQHLLSAGSADGTWTVQGVLLCSAAHEQQYPTITGDGAGGAIVAWVDHRNGGSLNPQKDIFAGRVLANGTVAAGWPVNGTSLSQVLDSDQDLPRAVADGVGGAFVAWEDHRYGTFQAPDIDVFVTRVQGDGTIPATWTPNGVSTARIGGQQVTPVLVADGVGGAIVAWADGRDTLSFPINRDVFAQHFTGAGARVAGWPALGVDLSLQPQAQTGPVMVTDGAGGALVAWQDWRPGADVYGQHVRFDGTLSPGWPVDGRLITGALNEQIAPTLVSDGAGGAICAWQDDRAGFSNNDIWAQRFFGSGQVGPTVGVAPGPLAPGVALGFAGAHPVRGAGRFRLRQPEAGPVWAAVYDVRGRAVATLARGDAFPAGESVLAWDGRTARGAVAPAGVYQLRAVTRTGEATLRFVDIP